MKSHIILHRVSRCAQILVCHLASCLYVFCVMSSILKYLYVDTSAFSKVSSIWDSQDMFLSRHVSDVFSQDTFLPRHVSLKTRFCQDTFLPRHVSPKTRFSRNTFLSRHVSLATRQGNVKSEGNENNDIVFFFFFAERCMEANLGVNDTSRAFTRHGGTKGQGTVFFQMSSNEPK